MGLSLTCTGTTKFIPFLGVLLLSFLLAGCNAEKVKSYDLKVTSVSPNEGSRTGGTAIFIDGSGLAFVESVTIGGAECETLTRISDGRVSCTTPEGAVGDATVVVKNKIGKTDTSVFTYFNVPLIDSITPAVGPMLGGTDVVISGSGFEEGLQVTFGSVPCTLVNVIDEETIECRTGASAVFGYVTTTVSNPDGRDGVLRAFAYRAEPTVDAITPDGGSVNGGTPVTISGTGFSNGATVLIGGKLCTPVVVVSSTTLNCTTTSNSGTTATVDVEVINSSGLSGEGSGIFTYQPAPTVASITPNNAFASVETNVVIRGTGFISGATVNIGNFNCHTVNFIDDTEIRCKAPVGADGTYDVTVTNPDTQKGTLDDGFNYAAAPYVSSVSPSSGISTGGTNVTITGNYFRGPVTVSLGGINCTGATVVDVNTITCTTGGTTTGPVTVSVTNTDTQVGTLVNGYTYRGQPTVTGVTPLVGMASGGTTVTVTGTNFYAGATVQFGGTACTNVTVAPNGLSLTCRTPLHAAGGVAVKVINDDAQEGEMLGAFTFQDPPTFTSINPTRGAPSGNTLVTITGTNFYAGATVYFNSTPCTNVSVAPTTITCRTPAMAEGPTTVTVTNTDSQSASSVGGYNFQAVILDWDLTSHDFGQTSSMISRTFTLTNTGENASGTVSLSFVGTDSPGFSLTANGCTGVLAAGGGSCTVQVNFLGGTVAERVWEVDLMASTSSGYATSATVEGEAVDALITWDVSSFDHGTVAVDDAKIFTLTNSGSQATSALTISKTGTDPTAWDITGNTCGAVLGAGDTCQVTVTFLAGSLGAAQSRTFTLRASAQAGGTDTIPISGQTP